MTYKAWSGLGFDLPLRINQSLRGLHYLNL